ncbi:ty3-gypsy retrotransposon protein [Tanacetum coccineum]
MDADKLHMLLKDHVAANQREAEAFQAQMAALQAELQATKGLIQATHNEGGGTLVDQRVHVVGFNLEGDATEWFRWMTRNRFIMTWDGFFESVQNCFGPCKYKDPQGALSKWLQKGTVAQYQIEFEKLMNRVTDISEGLLISFYISGLKPALQRELLVSKPTSLGDAFSLARITKARLDDHATIMSTSWLESSSGV